MPIRDESVICTVHGADAADVDNAVAAARRAFNGPWRDLDTAVRGELLHKLADLVVEQAHVLATIDAWDNGTEFQSRSTMNTIRSSSHSIPL